MSNNNEILERLKNLEESRKDFWDKLQIISSIIAPILASIIVYMLGNDLKQIDKNLKIIEHEKLKSEITALLSQVENDKNQTLINNSLHIKELIELASDNNNSLKREYGVFAIENSSLRNETKKKILDIIKETDKEPKVRKKAKELSESINPSSNDEDAKITINIKESERAGKQLKDQLEKLQKNQLPDN